jgi:alanine racemase
MRLTFAEINLKALRFNIDGIRKKIGPGVKMMGVVKANAYGHGIEAVAAAMVEYGVDYLGVGFLEEGIVLRKSGITHPILVLGGVLGNQVKEFLANNLEITISSLELADSVNKQAGSFGNGKARVHLKIDTGMERIGVHSGNAKLFIEKIASLKHLQPVGIYSHFASSDSSDKSFAMEQLDRFNTVISHVNKSGIDIPLRHLANSGAVLDLPQSYFTMVRPGIMTYGAYPSHETSESIPIQPVMTLRSKVVFVKEVAAGTGISYGRTYYTKSRTKIATVPIGYGDGYSRRLTNKTEVLIGGKRYPVVGTICMDQMMVDVGVDAGVKVGDDVTLIGSDGTASISSWEIADKLGTIPYEVFTGITARVPRNYV